MSEEVPTTDNSIVEESVKLEEVHVRPFYHDVEGQGFSTGFDITSAEEEERRRARAARFNTEIVNYEAVVQGISAEEIERRRARAERFADAMSDEIPEFPEPLSSLELAHVPEEETQREISNFDPTAARRWDTIHIFGSRMLKQNMSTEHILKLFSAYGAVSVEWITDYRCNVVFGDSFSAKRALYLESKERLHDCNALKQYLIAHEIAVEFAEEDIPYVVWRRYKPSGEAHFTQVRDAAEADDNAALYGGEIKRERDPLVERIDDPAFSMSLRVATVTDIKDPPGSRVMSLYYQRNKSYHEQLRRKRARTAAERAKQGLPAEQGARVVVPVRPREEEATEPVIPLSEREDVIPAVDADVTRKGRGFKTGREGVFDLSAPRHVVVKRSEEDHDRRRDRSRSRDRSRDRRDHRDRRDYERRDRDRDYSRGDRRDRHDRDARDRYDRRDRHDRSYNDRRDHREPNERLTRTRRAEPSTLTERPRVRMDAANTEEGATIRYADIDVEQVGLGAIYARYQDEVEADLERRRREDEERKAARAAAAEAAAAGGGNVGEGEMSVEQGMGHEQGMAAEADTAME